MLRLVKKTAPKKSKPEPKPQTVKVKAKHKTKTVMKTVQQTKPKAAQKPKRQPKPKLAPVPEPKPTHYPSGLPIVSMEERKAARVEAHIRLLANLHLAKVYLKTVEKEVELYKRDKRAKEIDTAAFKTLSSRFEELERVHRCKLDKARALNTEGVKNEETEVKKQPKHGSTGSGPKEGQKIAHRTGGNRARIEERAKGQQGDGETRKTAKKGFLKRRG